MAPVAHITRACSRRSRPSRRLLAQAPRQSSSLLKLVLGIQPRCRRRVRHSFECGAAVRNLNSQVREESR